MSLSEVIQNEIRVAFPGMFNVPLQLAAPFVGIAYKTARNHGDSFQLKTTLQGRRRFVSVVELARYLIAQEGGAEAVDGRPDHELTLSPADPAPLPPKRGPGAPRKAERVAAAAAGLSVRDYRKQQRGAQ